MPLARSLTQKLSSKLGRASSGRKSPVLETPSPTDEFVSISFADTRETPTTPPQLGEPFMYQSKQHTYNLDNSHSQPKQHTVSLSRASSLLSRRSTSSKMNSSTPTTATTTPAPSLSRSSSLRRELPPQRVASDSSVFTLPGMTFSPAPSVTSFPETPSSLHHHHHHHYHHSGHNQVMPTVHSSRSSVSSEQSAGGYFGRHQQGQKSLASSTYSAAASLTGNHQKKMVSEDEADLVAMRILERVSAQEYLDDIEACFA